VGVCVWCVCVCVVCVCVWCVCVVCGVCVCVWCVVCVGVCVCGVCVCVCGVCVCVINSNYGYFAKCNTILIENPSGVHQVFCSRPLTSTSVAIRCIFWAPSLNNPER